MPDITIVNPPIPVSFGNIKPLELPNTVIAKRSVVYGGFTPEPLIFQSSDAFGLVPSARGVVSGTLTVTIIPRDVAECAIGTNHSAYDIGDKVRLSFQFTAGGIGIEPGAISVSVCKPDLSEANITSDALYLGNGVYRCDYKPSLPGIHWIRVQGSEPAYAAGEVSVMVRSRQVLSPGVF